MNDFKLDDHTKISPGFTTPDAYFDSFSERLLQRLPTAEPKVISLWARNKKWIYATAAVIVLSLSIPVMDYFKNDTEAVYASEMENYLTYHSTLTDDDIVELLSDEEIATLNIDNALPNNELESLLTDNVNLEDYIID